MREILSRVRWFFTGLRLVIPLLPRFVWSAFRTMLESTVEYWRDSQSVVEKIADNYQIEATEELVTEYDTFLFWACFSLASFLYLVGWCIQAWLTVMGIRLLVSGIF